MLEIGANLSLIVLALLEAVGRSGAVFAFEPIPQLAMLLPTQFPAPNLFVNPLAVSSRSGIKTLYHLPALSMTNAVGTVC